MKQPSSYLRMRVLGAIDSAQGNTIIQRVKNVAQLTFTDEEGHPRQFTWRTIQTWLSRYKKNGVTTMQTKPRSDKGKTRNVTPEEVLEAINTARPHFRKDKMINRSGIYRFCIEEGLLDRNNISRTSFFRVTKAYDLFKNDDETNNKMRHAFAMQYANQLWQGDTMFGPYISIGHKGHKQTKLIAFIDDASRVICHAEFFLEETIDSLVKALKAAFYKRGIPEQLYVDNGSIYTSQEITLICARIGTILRHTPVRDGAAKGKIERFFRRVRQQFLSRVLDLSSLDILNRQLTTWVEDEYNTTSHSSLGMKPIDRFGMDLKRIKFLPPSEANDELFFAEATRKVKKDNTFSFKSIRFETPTDLRDKIIHIRFDRRVNNRVIIYYKNQRIGVAKPLDLIANGLLKRKETSS